MRTRLLVLALAVPIAACMRLKDGRDRLGSGMEDAATGDARVPTEAGMFDGGDAPRDADPDSASSAAGSGGSRFPSDKHRGGQGR